MPDIRLPRELHAIGQHAIDEAIRRGAGTVEAEHVLLAIAAAGGIPGLDHATLDAALERERERSLAFAGVADVRWAPGDRESTRRVSKPGWGASIRELLRASDKPTDRNAAAIRRELAIGILRAEVGTVPRALAIAGIDRAELTEVLKKKTPKLAS
jgi:Clp amino terminal domain, pathogenicity island component